MAHERTSVKSLKVFWLGFVALMILGVLVGCDKMATQSPDVSDSIRKSLDQAGLKDVSVSQDRDKGVVTLGGHVAADAGKSQACPRLLRHVHQGSLRLCLDPDSRRHL